MRLCVIGIGGCGGKVAEQFLGNQDLSMKIFSDAIRSEYISSGGIKGIWLESDKNDAENKQKFFGDLKKGCYPGFFIPHDSIPAASKTHNIIYDKYGYDVKKHGYFRDAQYLKSIYEIFKTDDDIRNIASEELKMYSPIFDSAWAEVRRYITMGGGVCDGILFIISLGGGTGTGFVNPIVNHIRETGSGDYPVFVLGVLTEEGDFADTEQFAKEARRNLSAISSMYDLITKRNGVDCLILVDNQILMDKCKNDYAAVDRYLYDVMKPVIAGRDFPGEKPPSLAVKELFIDGESLPPIQVPCYWSQSRTKNSERELVSNALDKGRLCGCEPKDADRAYVFLRGYLDTGKIRQAVADMTDLSELDIAVWRKLSDNRNEEILILLRNPYGSAGNFSRPGTLEHRLHNVINSAVSYIDESKNELLHLDEFGDSEVQAENGNNEDLGLTDLTRNALENYFYGDRGLRHELQDAVKRIEEGQKPLFQRELTIFDGFGKAKAQDPAQINEESLKGILTEDQRRLIENMIKEEVARQIRAVMDS